jgi:hypothetical protein
MIGSNTVDSTTSVGTGNSIAIGLDGLPIITYYDFTNLRLKIAKCTAIDCSTSITHVLFTAVSGTVTSSITIGPDGNPTIALHVSSGGGLVVDHCADATCSVGTTSTTVDATGNVGSFPSITYGTDDLPIIAYYDATNGHPKVAHCVDAGCVGTPTIVTIDPFSTDNDGQYTSITIGANGLPVIAYQKSLAGFTGQQPMVATCVTITCAGATVVHPVDSAQFSGAYTSLAIGVDGNPVVAYYDATAGQPALATCVDMACAGPPTKAFLDSNVTTGDLTSLVIGTDGNPVVSYMDQGTGKLRVVLCSTRTCTGTLTSRVLNSPGIPYEEVSSITLGADGNPVIAYWAAPSSGLRVARVTHSSWTKNGWGH